MRIHQAAAAAEVLCRREDLMCAPFCPRVWLRQAKTSTCRRCSENERRELL